LNIEMLSISRRVRLMWPYTSNAGDTILCYELNKMVKSREWTLGRSDVHGMY